MGYALQNTTIRRCSVTRNSRKKPWGMQVCGPSTLPIKSPRVLRPRVAVMYRAAWTEAAVCRPPSLLWSEPRPQPVSGKMYPQRAIVTVPPGVQNIMTELASSIQHDKHAAPPNVIHSLRGYRHRQRGRIRRAYSSWAVIICVSLSHWATMRRDQHD